MLLDECTSRKDSQDTLRLAFSKFQQGELSIDEVHGYVNVTKLQNKFQTGKLELSKKLGTTKYSVFRLQCLSKDMHQCQKNRAFDYALRMYTQNVEFVRRHGSCKLRQECQIVLADCVEPTS